MPFACGERGQGESMEALPLFLQQVTMDIPVNIPDFLAFPPLSRSHRPHRQEILPKQKE